LTHSSDKIGARSTVALISVGFFSKFGIPRTTMKYELETWNSLTKKEMEWVRDNTEDVSLIEKMKKLMPTKKEGGGTFSAKRKEVIENLIYLLEKPPHSLEDNPETIAALEKEYLGIPITYSKVDSCEDNNSDSTCRELVDGKKGKMTLAVEISRVSEWTIKKGKSKGQKMAFLTIEDSSCEMDNAIVFPEAWEKYKTVISENNTVLLFGDTPKDKDGFIINKALQI